MKKVYVDMVGDLFHWGHVEILRRARALGDHLAVGVISDSVAASYKRLPVMTMEERIAVIEACRFVDSVIPDAPFTVTAEFIDLHAISLVVHGSDLSAAALEDMYGEALGLGKLRILDYTEGISTSEIIDRIRRHDAAEPALRPTDG